MKSSTSPTDLDFQKRIGMTGGREDFFTVEQEVNNILHRVLDVFLSTEKLTPPQFICIERLYEMNRPCKMSELADSILMRPAVMTGVVDRLSALDFVKRGFDETDRRIILLTLTARGLQALSRVNEKLRMLARRFTARVSKEDLEAAVRVRKKYAEFLSKELKSPQAKI